MSWYLSGFKDNGRMNDYTMGGIPCSQIPTALLVSIWRDQDVVINSFSHCSSVDEAKRRVLKRIELELQIRVLGLRDT